MRPSSLPKPERPPGMPDPLAVAMGYRECCDSFPGLERYSEGSLDVGVSLSLSFGRLRSLLKEMRADHPAVQFRFVEAEGLELAESVAEGRLDVAFVQGETGDAPCVVEPLWAERLLVALPEGHLLARQNALPRELLRGETVLIRAGDLEPAIASDLVVQALGGPPAAMLSIPVQRETLLNLVALGFGVSLVPACSLGAFYPGVVYKPFEGRQPFTPVHCVWRLENRKPELRVLLERARSIEPEAPGRID